MYVCVCVRVRVCSDGACFPLPTQKWKHLIVGWLPRAHGQRIVGNTTTFTYFRGLSRGKFARYSLVLTGEAFIHISYLKMFTNTLPKEVQDMIDSFQNCEDITMNVMVAHLLAKSGHPQCSGLRIVPSTKIRNLEKQSSKQGLWLISTGSGHGWNHVADLRCGKG